MLTDDDLTRQLGSAFRDAAGGLEYAGRVPTPRSPLATVGVPLASTAAVVATLAVVWAASSEPEDNLPPTADGRPTTSAAPDPTPAMVTERVQVAGFSFRYRHPAGEPRADDLYATVGRVTVPADATSIDAPAGVQAWVGTDPTSGDHGVWVQAPTRNGGKVFAVLSPTWTTDELTDLFLHGQPRAVPAVG